MLFTKSGPPESPKQEPPRPPTALGLLSVRASGWWLWDGAQRRFVDRLTPEQMLLPKEALTFPKAIVLARSYYPLLRRAGLPRLTFNVGTRHTAATLMIGAGVHIRIVAERLGHADPAVTLRVYSHVTPTMQREAADKLDAVIGART